MNPVGSIHLFPPLRIAICLIAGIILGDVLMPSPWLPIAGFCLLLFSAACFRHTYWQGAAVMLASVFFGCTLVTIDKESLGVPASVGQTVAYRAVLLSEPVERGKVIRCDLMVTTGEWSGKKLKASILRDTVDSHYKHLHVNDGILASSVIELPVNYHDSNFDYVRYLESHGFVGTTFIYWSDWQKTAADLAAGQSGRPEDPGINQFPEHHSFQYYALCIGVSAIFCCLFLWERGAGMSCASYFSWRPSGLMSSWLVCRPVSCEPPS